MDVNSMITISGLVAFVVAYAAVSDSEGRWRGTVGPMRWSLSGSWASSSAVAIGLAFFIISEDHISGQLFGFALVALLAPLIYKGLGRSGGASKQVFFICSVLVSWATFSILYVAATSIPDLIGSLPLLSKLIVNATLVLALVGTVLHTARSLAAAVSGDGSTVWDLP